MNIQKELLELTPFELKLRAVFKEMDRNVNGTLDRDELRAALRALGQDEVAVEALLAGCSCSVVVLTVVMLRQWMHC